MAAVVEAGTPTVVEDQKLAMVYVVVAHDCPMEVFTTRKMAERYANHQQAATDTMRAQGIGLMRTHWRIYAFPLRDGIPEHILLSPRRKQP